jgi:uncharacterized protein YdiU (UPF0061 family)
MKALDFNKILEKVTVEYNTEQTKIELENAEKKLKNLKAHKEQKKILQPILDILDNNKVTYTLDLFETFPSTFLKISFGDTKKLLQITLNVMYNTNILSDDIFSIVTKIREHKTRNAYYIDSVYSENDIEKILEKMLFFIMKEKTYIENNSIDQTILNLIK